MPICSMMTQVECQLIYYLIEFQSRDWKPVSEPFKFPSPDEPSPPDLDDHIDEDLIDENFDLDDQQPVDDTPMY